jgi:hypothetical protein
VRGPLDGVQAKLERACEDMDTLHHAYETALREDRIRVRIDPSDRLGYYDVKVERLPELPSRIGAIIGDVLHNLRSALDHLVWQLAIFNGVRKPRQGTAYVMADSAKDFRNACHRLIDLDPAHQAMIEERQPYNLKGKGLPELARLRILNNRDKHRALIPVMVRSLYVGETPAFEGVNCSVEETEIVTSGDDLDVGGVIARLKLSNLEGEPNVKLNGYLIPDVRFSESQESIPATFLLIGGKVVIVVKEFEPILEPRPLMDFGWRRLAGFAVWPPHCP